MRTFRNELVPRAMIRGVRRPDPHPVRGLGKAAECGELDAVSRTSMELSWEEHP